MTERRLAFSSDSWLQKPAQTQQPWGRTRTAEWDSRMLMGTGRGSSLNSELGEDQEAAHVGWFSFLELGAL